MKKISLALATAGLTASLGVFAALPTDAQPFQLVVPNLQSGIEITLEGLYLRPSNSNLDYANVGTLSVDDDVDFFDVDNQIETVSPDYNFGFRVGLGYIFPNSGNDVQVAWTHFNHSTTDSFNAPDPSLLTLEGVPVPILVDSADQITIDPLLSIYGDASVTSEAEFKLDSIDLNVGQYVDIGTRMRMRMFGGLRFAQVTNNQSTDTDAFGSEAIIINEIETLVVDFAADVDEQFNSKFSGVGPQVGIDTSYHIGNCFGVAAHAAMAFLVGITDTRMSSLGTFGSSETLFVEGVQVGQPIVADTITGDWDLNSDDSTRIVPAFDAKLGLNWSYIFTNQSVLTLEGGYQWTQYVDAVDKLTTNDFGLTTERTTSSVGFDGPYLTLNWSV